MNCLEATLSASTVKTLVYEDRSLWTRASYFCFCTSTAAEGMAAGVSSSARRRRRSFPRARWRFRDQAGGWCRQGSLTRNAAGGGGGGGGRAAGREVAGAAAGRAPATSPPPPPRAAAFRVKDPCRHHPPAWSRNLHRARGKLLRRRRAEPLTPAAMPSAAVLVQKQKYEARVHKLLSSYTKVFTVDADNVASKQFMDIRAGLRTLGAEVLMGKNTLMKRCIRKYVEKTGEEKWPAVADLLVGNIGLCFVKGGLNEAKDKIQEYKVGP